MFLFNYLESWLFSPGCRKTDATALGTEAAGFMGPWVLDGRGSLRRDVAALQSGGDRYLGGPSGLAESGEAEVSLGFLKLGDCAGW